MHIKGSAQKFETLQDGSCKLSTYYPREYKKQVLELEGGEVVTMSIRDFNIMMEILEGKAFAVPQRFIDFIKTIRTTADDMIKEAEGEVKK